MIDRIAASIILLVGIIIGLPPVSKWLYVKATSPNGSESLLLDGDDNAGDGSPTPPGLSEPADVCDVPRGE